MKNRKIPEIVMDILKDYSMCNEGSKPLLDYLDEIMAAYGEMEKEFLELSLWQEDMKKDLIDIKKTMKKLKQ